MRTFLPCAILLLSSSGLMGVNALELARSFFGPEEKLKAVTSIYYDGKIVDPSGKDSGTFRLYLKKPYCQRMEIQIGDLRTITAVNGAEGYRQQINQSTGRGRIGILHPTQVEKIIVNTVENLYFLKGTQKRNGNVSFLGKADLQGRECYKLKFIYGDTLFYERYVDLENGKILSTEDERGVKVYQRGEIYSGGIRFSKSIESFKDKKHLNTIHFQKIMVNVPMTDDFFDFPKQ